jgi:uncharacterized protein YdeI (YjbR/CyaY-like superfamily)
MPISERPQVQFDTVEQLRAWFEANHATSPGIWLVSWRSRTGRPAIPYELVVEEALCFGWIDAQVKALDDERAAQHLAPRKPRSGWARSNKDRIERLIAAGRMRPAGLRAVEIARANGAWTLLDDAENLVVPADLAAALAANPPAAENFGRFAPSARKMIIGWVTTAKRPETRARRIEETARQAVENRRAVG